MQSNRSLTLQCHSLWQPFTVLFILIAVCFVPAGSCQAQGSAFSRPNILFIIADDASAHFGNSYHCSWIKTPHIDRLAKQGLVFDNAYVPTSKCAPTRAALLLGRYPWQNEEAANHQNHFPAKFISFTETLQKSGIYTGSMGKVWGPGSAIDAAGNNRNFGLPQSPGKINKPSDRFSLFIHNRPKGPPFFYWHGSPDPHRAYKAGSGLEAGKKLSDIDRVPAYWPDNDIVRSDMLDYAIEVEQFDSLVGELIEMLNSQGQLEHTLIVVTSDHGMPFPRVKGHTYHDAHRVPLIMHWPAGIKNPGRRIPDFVSAIDFAPTFLELMDVKPESGGMSPITGKSFVDILKGTAQVQRPFVLIGRERNDVYARPGSPTGLGYPARGIRHGDFLYVKNFTPDRWPCGNEEYGFLDTDDSPTKQFIQKLGAGNVYWEHSFGKRPAEQLFNVKTDPDCVKNLANDPQFAKDRIAAEELLLQELKRQQDPRMLGNGDVFDHYPTVKKAPADWK